MSLAATLESDGYVGASIEFLLTGHPQICGTLDGQPVRLLLDTGAGSTVVDLDYAKSRGLKLQASDLKGGGAGAAVISVSELPQSQLSVGSVWLKDLRILALDFANIRGALAAKGVAAPEVILGADVLRPRSAVIDYGAKMLWLKSS